MLLTDSLIVIGMATASLGTIHESDGVVERTFWLRNSGTAAVTLVQGYTSCGCTTMQFDKNGVVLPGDSACVVLRFNPRGKGGEFYESGTLVYGADRKRIQFSIEGSCISSKETLLRQFPIRLNDHLRLSADRFDLGMMRVGDSKERSVVVLHTTDGNRQEHIPVTITISDQHGKGLQHIAYPIVIDGLQHAITLDVIIQ